MPEDIGECRDSVTLPAESGQACRLTSDTGEDYVTGEHRFTK
jgi:hypothetical protein